MRSRSISPSRRETLVSALAASIRAQRATSSSSVTVTFLSFAIAFCLPYLHRNSVTRFSCNTARLRPSEDLGLERSLREESSETLRQLFAGGFGGAIAPLAAPAAAAPIAPSRPSTFTRPAFDGTMYLVL